MMAVMDIDNNYPAAAAVVLEDLDKVDAQKLASSWRCEAYLNDINRRAGRILAYVRAAFLLYVTISIVELVLRHS